MAITPINNRYPGFIFDGENSRDYGVYITDVEVFGAPKRKVQMISIPGRNGDYALDEGSFENITVKYECALGAGTESDFNGGISDFRNWLASKVGYKTLSDEINTGEFRKGVFLDGMDVPTLNKKTGTFDVLFNCKPQRFLDSGETPVTMTNGGTITNPTLFESSPLLQVDGYGKININSDALTVYNIELGDISLPWECTINDPDPFGLSYSYTFSNTDFLNTGDRITFSSRKMRGGVKVRISGEVITSSGSNFAENITSSGGSVEKNQYWASNGFYDFTNTFINVTYYFYIKQPLVYGTSSTNTYTVSYTLSWTKSGGTSGSGTATEQFQVSYDGANSLTITYLAPTTTGAMTLTGYGWPMNQKNDTFDAYSTKSLNGTLYFDLDIGEAYTIDGGQITSANNVVEIPPELPTLKAGSNTITFDNTVTQLKIVPRWWKV